MVTKVITHLLTDALPVLVIKSAFSLLPLGRCLLPVITWNRYQSSGKFIFTTTSRNVTFVRCRMSLVTILFLDFVMIHWIRWIQRKSFRKTQLHLSRNQLANEPSKYCHSLTTEISFECFQPLITNIILPPGFKLVNFRNKWNYICFPLYKLLLFSRSFRSRGKLLTTIK